MLNKIRDYLDFSGLQYRSPDKAGAEREKMLAFRHKGQEARKAFTPNHSYLSQLDVTYQTPDLMSHFLPP
ncbi:hypothetical protein V2O99_10185, partial [Streptococcus pneumoniae]